MIRLAENLQVFWSSKPEFVSEIAMRSGLKVEHLKAWAFGSAEPSLSELVALAESLQVGLSHLLTGECRVLPPIRLLTLDVDGVLTDGSIILTENGDEIKRFFARDGRAIMSARKQGIEVAFISGGSHPRAILERAHRLGVSRVHVGKEPKLQVLQQWLTEMGISMDEVAHIGDDANDLDLMGAVGFCACPGDAAPRNKEVADLILRESGGRGCVREFIELHLGVEVD
jgi:YrbI family 3-deoxy-D-manno-octulosonate 8-phosphate phosphatase